MPRKKSPHLTDAELRLMEVVWRKRSATVSDVTEALDGSAPLAYSSVLTTLRILERKGYLGHTKDGRAFVYHPLIGRDQARQSALTHLVRRFFEGSSEQLMLNLIESQEMDAKELARLRKRIEEVQK